MQIRLIPDLSGGLDPDLLGAPKVTLFAASQQSP